MTDDLINTLLSWIPVFSVLVVVIVSTGRFQKMQLKRLDRQVDALERIAAALEAKAKG